MKKYLYEIKALLKLAIPVLIAQVAQTSMGFVDTIMAGGVSAPDMAAVAVAASIWFPVILFSIGLLMALIPVVAQLNGSGKQDKVSFQIQQGIFLAIIMSIPTIYIVLQSQAIITYMNLEPALEVKTIGYLHAIVWAVPAFLLYQVMRSFAEGCSITIPSMLIGFIGLVLNIPLNWIFVYGKFGMPALGGVGCGVATCIVYWLMCISMCFLVCRTKKLSSYAVFKNWSLPNFKAIWHLFTLGLPVAAAAFFEVTLFAVVALLIAPLGAAVVASHQVAQNFSSIMFMIPFSLGTAASIRVGFLLGDKKIKENKIAIYTALGVGLALSCCSAIFTIIYRFDVAKFYNSDPQVVAMAGSYMLFSAIYQCVDSFQVISAGVLRGYKDMRSIFGATFVSYWMLGLPVGYILALTDLVVPRMGPSGFWIGFIIGLSSAAILLGLRIRWMQKQSSAVQLEFANR